MLPLFHKYDGFTYSAPSKFMLKSKKLSGSFEAAVVMALCREETPCNYK